jgi:POT family proton-dependent oligopeptide transporter
MFIATIFFWAGRKKMVHVPPAGLGYLKETFSGEGLKTLGRIAMVYVFIMFFWALWDMSNGVEWTLQAQKMDLHFLGLNLQAAQVQTANPILILLFIPLVNYVLYPLINRVFTLTPLRKIGIGLYLTGFSFCVILYAQHLIDLGQRPTIWWQMLAYVILTLGEAMVSITGLEFSYTQAPNSMKSSVMALWLFAIASGNLFDARFNAWMLNPDGTTKLTEFQFYEFFTVLMFAAATLFVFFACFYKGRTHLQSQEPGIHGPPEMATELGMP